MLTIFPMHALFSRFSGRHQPPQPQPLRSHSIKSHEQLAKCNNNTTGITLKMSSGTAGIQELMAAETRASEIVALARLARGDRMKQAKLDAQSLTEAYKAEKQEEFNNRVLAAGGTGGSASAKLQAETNTEIQVMQGQFQRTSQKAIDVLLSKCCEVSLEVPTARVRATQKAYGVAK